MGHSSLSYAPCMLIVMNNSKIKESFKFVHNSAFPITFNCCFWFYIDTNRASLVVHVRYSFGEAEKKGDDLKGGRLPLFRQGGVTVSLTTRLSKRGIREASYLKGGLWKRYGKRYSSRMFWIIFSWDGICSWTGGGRFWEGDDKSPGQGVLSHGQT